MCFHIKLNSVLISAWYLDIAPLYTCYAICYTTTMDVARYQFHNVPPIWPVLQKVVLRLSEHGDVIETPNNKVCRPKSFLANSIPTSRISFCGIAICKTG